jgi:hypothetical protein
MIGTNRGETRKMSSGPVCQLRVRLTLGDLGVQHRRQRSERRQPRIPHAAMLAGQQQELRPAAAQRTRPGYWMPTYSQKQWQEEYEDQPIRLLIACRRAGYEPWSLLREVVARAGPEERVRQILDQDSSQMTGHYARLQDTIVHRHCEAAAKSASPDRRSPSTRARY